MSQTQDNAQRLIADLAMPYDIGPIGNLRQIAQPQSPARSNSSWQGLTAVELALQAAGVLTSVAVPVQVGDIITKILVPVGNVAGAGVKNVFAGVYAGTGAKPAKIATVKAFTPTSEEVAKNVPLELTLEEPLTITTENAPHGYVYVGVGCEAATTLMKGIGVNCVTAVHVALAGISTGAPLFLANKSGSGLAAAPATIAAVAAVEPVPLIILI